jgi:hypothetical protein
LFAEIAPHRNYCEKWETARIYQGHHIDAIAYPTALHQKYPPLATQVRPRQKGNTFFLGG